MDSSLNLKVDLSGVLPFLTVREIDDERSRVSDQCHSLLSGTGAGADYLGWLRLPDHYCRYEYGRMEELANRWRAELEVVVIVGIGGSYMGAKAVIEALSSSFSKGEGRRGSPEILFAGQNLSSDYLGELLKHLEGREVGVVVISKSGTTLEPSITFRILKAKLVEWFGESQLSKRVVIITDPKRGVLREMASEEGYLSFSIPPSVGGRHSIFTAVALFPILLAGFDGKEFLKGAYQMMLHSIDKGGESEPATYALVRNLLYKKGFIIEMLITYNPKLLLVGEWWKQLFGESEGKEGRGVFPATALFTTDLHSMGQYLQEGERVVMESVIKIEQGGVELTIPEEELGGDGLSFITGKRLSEIEECALNATKLAHVDGGVPTMVLELTQLNSYTLGQLLYFFQFASALSGYLLGINPFDQPGVEAYKRNLNALLGKKGFEELKKELTRRA